MQNFSRNNSRDRGRNINSNYRSDRSREKDYLPGGTIIIIINKMQILGSDQGPGVDPTQE